MWRNIKKRTKPKGEGRGERFLLYTIYSGADGAGEWDDQGVWRSGDGDGER